MSVIAVSLAIFQIYPKELTGKVVKVFDGDTIEVAGRIIRLKGIDAPEKDQESFDGIRIGQHALSYLKKRVLGKVVTIKYKEYDSFQRILGEVYIAGENLNEELLLMGQVIVYKDFDYPKHYREIEASARFAKRGIFASYGFISPSMFRKKKAIAKDGLL